MGFRSGRATALANGRNARHRKRIHHRALRPAGVLTFSDPYGRILAEQPSAAKPDARIVHDIPAGPGATFYCRYGDWFGWLSVALLCGSVRAKRRTPIDTLVPSS